MKAFGFGHEIFTADRCRIMGQQAEKVTEGICSARQHMTQLWGSVSWDYVKGCSERDLMHQYKLET